MKSIQAIANNLAGTAGLTTEGAVSKYFNITPYNKYTLQDLFSIYSNISPTNNISVQQMLFDNVKDSLNLSGESTEYSEQDLWNKAFDAGLGLGEIVSNMQGYIKSLSGLVAYYPMDETSGSTTFNRAPDTVGTLDGTITGATINQTGQVGQAYSFDGTNNQVEVANMTNHADIVGKNTLTMIAVCKFTSTPSVDAICGMRNSDSTDSFYMMALGDTLLEFRWRNSTGTNTDLTPTVSALNGRYVIFAFVANGTSLKLYENGSEIDSGTISGTFGDGTGRSFYIGQEGNGNYFPGIIQHVALFGTALSDDDLLNIAKISGLA